MMNSDDGFGRPSSGDDLADALREAERLLADYSAHHITAVRLRQLRLSSAVVTVAGAVFIVGLPGWLAAVSAVAAALGAVTIVYVSIQLRAVEAVVEGEHRSMSEVADLVRELLPTVSARESWSSTQTRQMRARIERFPV
jgi:hypothetical protein